MKVIVLILFAIFLVMPLQAGTLYRWLDKDGVVNFTDDLSNVPPPYRDRVKAEERKDVQEEVTPPPAQAVTRESQENEIKRDIYGRDEAWWRDKVRPWKEQLKEATENYEVAQRKFAEKTVEMGRKGLVSRARHQMEAEKYNEEKVKYETQITEAKAMLEKLRREAQESKADPDWLE